VHSVNQHAGYYYEIPVPVQCIMEQIIRQLVFDQLAVGKHLLTVTGFVCGGAITPTHTHEQ
jgi:hypothetical protein